MKKNIVICFTFGIILIAFTFSEVLAAEYVAFSLKVAQERILSTPKGKDYRKLHPEVFTLGGITKIRGLVYDRKNEDVIMVGERDPERSILTLDDLVVALRARFIHGKWPLVSIDPTEGTKKTDMQIVRFEGGIENTEFGQDLFDADYRLKKIGMGLLPSGVPGLKTYWNLGMERAKEHSGGSHKIGSRFWFYPVLPSVTVREDVVAIKGLKVGVFTEVLSAEIDGKEIEDLSTFQDQAGDIFAKEVSEKFENLATVHPSFSRLQGLDELVALTRAIEEMPEKPDLESWLRQYIVKVVRTKRKVKVLVRSESYELPAPGRTHKLYHELTISGGVQLMALALRLKAGDVTALKGVVLKTRPKPDTLSWNFVVADWGIAKATGVMSDEGIIDLFMQAAFLREKERYEDAISIYNKTAQIEPKFEADSLLGKALVYREWAISTIAKQFSGKSDLFAQHHFRKSISLLIKSVQVNPNLAEAYHELGVTLRAFGKTDGAIVEFKKALAIDKNFYAAHALLGFSLFEMDQHEEASKHLNKYLQFDNSSETAKEAKAIVSKIEKTRRSEDEYITYKYDERAFSFRYPKTWDVLTKGDILGKTQGRWSGGRNTVLAVVNSKNFDENVDIQAIAGPGQMPSRTELKEMIGLLDTEFPKHYPGFRKLSARIFKKRGCVGIEYIMENKRLDAVLKQREVILMIKGRTIILTFTAPKGSYNKVNTSCFQVLLDSLEMY